MKNIVLRGEHLSLRYEGNGVAVDALKEVSFQIEEKEFIVVLGPSGSMEKNNTTGEANAPLLLYYFSSQT